MQWNASPRCVGQSFSSVRMQESSVALPPARRAPLSEKKASSWPERCQLAYAFLWEYSYDRLVLAQLLGQLGVFLTLASEYPPPFWT
jgi:hypothetical protein